MARQNIEVILGGGRRFFNGTGPGSQDLFPTMTGYTIVETADALAEIDLDEVTALVGLFEEGPMPAAPSRRPTLSEMTDVALQVLAKDPDGFFLMVEGSQPDWRGHQNQPLEDVVAEMLDFDAAIGRGLAYQREEPGTLIVVVADHETGGLAVGANAGDSLVGRYTTMGHTAQMIPLFAAGPGAERFGGIIDNYRVGELLIAAVNARRAAPGGP